MAKKVCIEIWGREFLLPVEFDCYDDEVVLEQQNVALDDFLEKSNLIMQSKKSVEKFTEKYIPKSEINDNIFTYVLPEYIFIRRETKPSVAIMCRYKYDPEHGLAVVFKYNNEIEIGIQDIIL